MPCQNARYLRSLCYVEIKTHKTRLLHSSSTARKYGDLRTNWRSRRTDSQNGATRDGALGERLDILLDAPHHAGAQFFNDAPRAVVVCGRSPSSMTSADKYPENLARSNSIDAVCIRQT